MKTEKIEPILTDETDIVNKVKKDLNKNKINFPANLCLWTYEGFKIVMFKEFNEVKNSFLNITQNDRLMLIESYESDVKIKFGRYKEFKEIINFRLDELNFDNYLKIPPKDFYDNADNILKDFDVHLIKIYLATLCIVDNYITFYEKQLFPFIQGLRDKINNEIINEIKPEQKKKNSTTALHSSLVKKLAECLMYIFENNKTIKNLKFNRTKICNEVVINFKGTQIISASSLLKMTYNKDYKPIKNDYESKLIEIINSLNFDIK